jgi:multidrug transporter EmrE-like cation transporter
MGEQQKKEWKEKAADYKTFGSVLLALSVFFYVGTLIPVKNSAVSLNTQPFLIVFVLVLLVFSFYFFRKSVKYIRLLRESEQ